MIFLVSQVSQSYWVFNILGFQHTHHVELIIYSLSFIWFVKICNLIASKDSFSQKCNVFSVWNRTLVGICNHYEVVHAANLIVFHMCLVMSTKCRSLRFFFYCRK